MTTLRLEIPAPMVPFATERRRHKIARGGRGSGKSWSIARILVARAAGERIRVLCCREVQKSIKESSYRLLADQIRVLGLGHLFDVQRDIIKGANGSEFVFTGLKDHTADSIKSFEGFDIAWIEEAHTISQQSANILIPTIRAPGSELWWSYNPNQATDYIHQRAEKPDANTLVVTINWDSNPWFGPELEGERLTMLAFNKDLYDHIWDGKCKSAAGLIFKRKWFRRFNLKTDLPPNLNLYVSSDWAVTPEEDEEGKEPDWTEHGVFGQSDGADTYAVDWWSGQEDTNTGIDALLALKKRYPGIIMGFEEVGVIRRAIGPARTRKMKETDTWLHIEGLPTAGGKQARAMGFAVRAASGNVYIPNTEWGDRLIDQLCAFTGEEGAVDDMVDACAYFARGLDSVADAEPVKAPRPEPPEPFTDDWYEKLQKQQAPKRIHSL